MVYLWASLLVLVNVVWLAMTLLTLPGLSLIHISEPTRPY